MKLRSVVLSRALTAISATLLFINVASGGALDEIAEGVGRGMGAGMGAAAGEVIEKGGSAGNQLMGGNKDAHIDQTANTVNSVIHVKAQDANSKATFEGNNASGLEGGTTEQKLYMKDSTIIVEGSNGGQGTVRMNSSGRK